MGDMREAFDLLREVNREAKAEAKERNVEALTALGLPWRKANDGAHWMLRGIVDVDVWPGTGRWRIGSRNGRGVVQLVSLLRGWMTPCGVRTDPA